MADDAKKDEIELPRSKLPIILGLVGAVAAIGVAAFLVLRPSGPAEAAAHPMPIPRPGLNDPPGEILETEPFIVNLDEPGASRYLKTNLVLEFPAESELGTALAARMPRVRDAIIVYLSGLTLDDTAGSAAKAAIREEIAARVEEQLGISGGIRVYFIEFVVQ